MWCWGGGLLLLTAEWQHSHYNACMRSAALLLQCSAPTSTIASYGLHLQAEGERLSTAIYTRSSAAFTCFTNLRAQQAPEGCPVPYAELHEPRSRLGATPFVNLEQGRQRLVSQGGISIRLKKFTLTTMSRGAQLLHHARWRFRGHL